MKYRKCEICGLKTERKEGKKRYFMARFPLDGARCRQWVKATGNQDLVYVPIEKLHDNKFVCGKHFKDKDFKKKKTQLKKTAVPTIRLTAVPLTDAILTEFPCHVHADNLGTREERTVENDTSTLEMSIESDDFNSSTLLSASSKELYSEDELPTVENTVEIETLRVSAIKNQGCRPQGRRWSNHMKGLSLAVYKKAPSVYRFLRQLMPMPSERTLQSVLQKVPMDPGLNDLVINYLKKKADKINDKEKVCVLLFDEMSLKKRLIYNSYSDKIEGYQDLGSHGRTGAIADKTLMFMLQGIYKKFKQPIAHYFVKGTISSEKLVVLIKEIITKIYEAGFQVIATVCDQGPTNVGGLNLLKKFSGLAVEENFFILDGRKIFILFDIPHLFKNIRNNFMQAGLLQFDGKIARWSHIREAAEKNVETHHFKNITPLHVDPSYRSKMKVNLAAQILSNTVKAILILMADKYQDEKEIDGTLKHDAMIQTANIVKELDQLFDCTNGPASKKDVKVGCRENVKKDSFHHELWSDYKRKIQSLTFLKSDSRIRLSNVRCINGYYMTLCSLQDIWKVVDNLGFKYLNLRQLNQDALENQFGIIRQHCPTNQNPTCHHFTAALKATILTRLNTPLRGSNCENDGNELILDFHDLVFSNTDSQLLVDTEHRYTSSLTEEGVEITIPDHQDFTIEEQIFENFEKQPLLYVSGYIAMALIKRIKINCSKCVNSLKNISPENENIYKYISLNEWQDEKKLLTYPTVPLCRAVEVAVKIFEEQIRVHLHQTDIGKYCRLIMLTNIDSSWMCQIHWEDVFEQFLLQISSLLIRNECKKVNRLINQNEQSCADYLKKAQAQGIAK